MSKPKVLIAHRPGPEIEAMLEDAPSELDIHFLPEGEKLGDHVSDAEILYGSISEEDFSKAKALRWIQQPFVGVEWARFPAFMESDVGLVNSRVLYGPPNCRARLRSSALADARHYHSTRFHETQALGMDALH